MYSPMSAGKELTPELLLAVSEVVSLHESRTQSNEEEYGTDLPSEIWSVWIDKPKENLILRCTQKEETNSMYLCCCIVVWCLHQSMK